VCVCVCVCVCVFVCVMVVMVMMAFAAHLKSTKIASFCRVLIGTKLTFDNVCW